jgi:Tol biopolymer transport system component
MSRRMTLPWLALAAAVTVVAVFCHPEPAKAANFGPIELVSKSTREQAEVGTEPALSADGRYAAFCAELGGRAGIFREELGTDQLAPVAVESIGGGGRCEGTPYASAPSISADGRYVSFTTDASLVPADTEANTSDVYVADMSTAPPTYELASAVNGSEEPGSEVAGQPEPMPGGSLAAGRVALSADGDRVAFVNQGNVYVRELGAGKTILISAKRDPLIGMTDEPVTGGGAFELAGAAISADGSTVAWVGEHLPEQVALFAAEEVEIKSIESTGTERDRLYHEPLWRRVPGTAEVAPPTRRTVGCVAGRESQCEGPYPGTIHHEIEFVEEDNGNGWGVRLPQLDSDGEEIALVGDPDEQYDLFVVDMQEGLDRLEAVHQVTRWTNPAPNGTALGPTLQSDAEYLPFLGEIAECAISPDGTRVAFATTRQRFNTPPYTLVTELPSAVGELAELYELDLETDRIERVTPGAGNELSANKASSFRSEQGAKSISFGGGDRLLGFSSAAENLVEGDANEGSDAFVVEAFPPAPIGTSSISPRPPQLVIQPAWRMTANAYSRPNGTIRIVARVPGPGTLRGAARAQLGGHLKSRGVASVSRRAEAAGTVMVDLKLAHGRSALARRPGLIARVHVAFTGSGGGPLEANLQSRFLVHHKRKRSGGPGKGKAR